MEHLSVAKRTSDIGELAPDHMGASFMLPAARHRRGITELIRRKFLK
ncbi:hypothetical protein [Allorhodopirellula heiligendammensis]|nr:hypothetical protein [Allorhodopirellula heiligendammensis]